MSVSVCVCVSVCASVCFAFHLLLLWVFCLLACLLCFLLCFATGFVFPFLFFTDFCLLLFFFFLLSFFAAANSQCAFTGVKAKKGEKRKKERKKERTPPPQPRNLATTCTGCRHGRCTTTKAMASAHNIPPQPLLHQQPHKHTNFRPMGWGGLCLHALFSSSSCFGSWPKRKKKKEKKTANQNNAGHVLAKVASKHPKTWQIGEHSRLSTANRCTTRCGFNALCGVWYALSPSESLDRRTGSLLIASLLLGLGCFLYCLSRHLTYSSKKGAKKEKKRSKQASEKASKQAASSRKKKKEKKKRTNERHPQRAKQED